MNHCEYTQEISAENISTSEDLPETLARYSEETEEEVTWECPHPTHDESDRCIFHLDGDDRSDVSAEDVQEAFLERLSSETPRSNQFIGAILPALDLHHRTIEVEGPSQVILDKAQIGYIDIRNSQIQPAIRGHDLTMRLFIGMNARFNGELHLSASSIGELELTGSVFSHHFWIESSEVSLISANQARFEEPVEVIKTTIHEGAKFRRCDFKNLANFSGTEFQSEFIDLEAESEEKLRRSSHMIKLPMQGIRRPAVSPDPEERLTQDQESNGEGEIEQMYFGGRSFVDPQYVHINDVVDNGADFRDTSFGGETVFNRTTFEYADFSRIEAPQISFIDSAIQGIIYFSGATLSEVDLRFQPIDLDLIINEGNDSPTVDLRNRARVYLDEAEIGSGRLSQPDDGSVFYDIQQAVVGNVSVKPVATAFNYLIIRRTDFEGFDFPEYRSSLRDVDWEIDKRPLSIMPYRGDYPEDREVTYLKAKQGAKSVGDSVSTSKFFQKEMYFRKGQYQLERGESLLKNWRSAGAFVANDIYRFTTGYGERVGRVVGSYFLLVIGVSAFLGVLLAPSRVLDVTIRLSEILLIGSASELPAWLQPLFRLFDRIVLPAFVALLVFTLSRSVER